MTATYDGHLYVCEVASEIQVYACCRKMDEAVWSGCFVANKLTSGPVLMLPPNKNKIIRKLEVCPFCGAKVEIL